MISSKCIAGLLAGSAMLLAACTVPAPIVGVPAADQAALEPAAAVEEEAAGAAREESEATEASSTPETSTQSLSPGRGPRPGFGPGSGMMARHHAVLPAEYAGLTNPVAADAQSLARGQELYQVNCATCHGEDGLGNGPAGQALDPAPANIAHTGQMLSDAYLFWRISEGGLPFGTSMPAWQDALDEQARWDLVNYMRALGDEDGRGRGLGRGPGSMGRGSGAGMAGDEAEHRAEMLEEALDRSQRAYDAETRRLQERVDELNHLVVEQQEVLNKLVS